MDDLLHSFADSLSPAENWQRRAHGAVDAVFATLQLHSRHSVSRCRVVGGVAKETSTCLKADMDVCVFYDDDAYRRVVLLEWKEILVQHTDLRDDDVTVTDFLLGFDREGVQIDLVAVKNLVDDAAADVATDLELRQLQQELSAVKASENPREAQKDLTLSVQSVEWMRQRSDFCRRVARLTKFWTQTILFEKKVWGASYIFELLAVAAAMEVEGRRSVPTPSVRRNRRGAPRHQPSISAALRRFFEIVSDLRRTRIVFPDVRFYRQTEIPLRVLNRTPVLVNPVNPFQNMLEIWQPVADDFMRTFSVCASETLKRLDGLFEEATHPTVPKTKNYKNDQKNEPGSVIVVTNSSSPQKERKRLCLSRLFEPQPLIRDFDRLQFFPVRLILETITSDELFPHAIVNADPPFPPYMFRHNLPHIRRVRFLKPLLLNFAAAIKARAFEDVAATKEELEAATKALIDESTDDDEEWKDTVETHEGRFCTLCIPLGAGRAQKISFDLTKLGEPDIVDEICENL